MNTTIAHQTEKQVSTSNTNNLIHDIDSQKSLAYTSNDFEILKQLTQSPFSEVRGVLAKRLDIDADILKILCNDSNCYVLGIIAEREHLSIDILNTLARNHDIAVVIKKH